MVSREVSCTKSKLGKWLCENGNDAIFRFGDLERRQNHVLVCENWVQIHEKYPRHEILLPV